MLFLLTTIFGRYSIVCGVDFPIARERRRACSKCKALMIRTHHTRTLRSGNYSLYPCPLYCRCSSYFSYIEKGACEKEYKLIFCWSFSLVTVYPLYSSHNGGHVKVIMRSNWGHKCAAIGKGGVEYRKYVILQCLLIENYIEYTVGSQRIFKDIFLNTHSNSILCNIAEIFRVQMKLKCDEKNGWTKAEDPNIWVEAFKIIYLIVCQYFIILYADSRKEKHVSATYGSPHTSQLPPFGVRTATLWKSA